MIREVGKEEALKEALNGKQVLMICDADSGDSVITTFNLTERLHELVDYEGAIFIVTGPQKAEKTPKRPKLGEEDRTKNKDGKERKNGVDVGMIKALFNAGWTAPQIADEMQIGVTTVYKYVNGPKEETAC